MLYTEYKLILIWSILPTTTGTVQVWSTIETLLPDMDKANFPATNYEGVQFRLRA